MQKLMGLAVFQKNIINKNRWQTGFGPWATVCPLEHEIKRQCCLICFTSPERSWQNYAVG